MWKMRHIVAAVPSGWVLCILLDPFSKRLWIEAVPEYKKKIWLCISPQALVLTGSHWSSLWMKISLFRLATWQNGHRKSAGWTVQRRCRSLSNQPPHHSRFREGPAVLVGDGPVDVALEEREHGEPDARSSTLLVGPGVGQSVVVQKESSGDVKCYEHIDRVVLVCRQDEEDAKEIQDPWQGVNEVPAPWSIYRRNDSKLVVVFWYQSSVATQFRHQWLPASIAGFFRL